VPVCRPTSEFQKAGHREVVAVLNVHWSAGRLFEQERSAKAFAQAIFPMCALLGRQITSWFEKAGGKPKPPPQQPLPPPEPPQLPPAPQVPPPAAVT
jgi:hypothetical protein